MEWIVVGAMVALAIAGVIRFFSPQAICLALFGVFISWILSQSGQHIWAAGFLVLFTGAAVGVFLKRRDDSTIDRFLNRRRCRRKLARDIRQGRI